MVLGKETGVCLQGEDQEEWLPFPGHLGKGLSSSREQRNSARQVQEEPSAFRFGKDLAPSLCLKQCVHVICSVRVQVSLNLPLSGLSNISHLCARLASLNEKL